MEMADDALFSKYNREQMIGEAKFIRAYTYFELVKTFGGVPCYTGVLDLDHERLGRASVEEIYSVIEQDLNDAVSVLPKKSEVLTTSQAMREGLPKARPSPCKHVFICMRKNTMR